MTCRFRNEEANCQDQYTAQDTGHCDKDAATEQDNEQGFAPPWQISFPQHLHYIVRIDDRPQKTALTYRQRNGKEIHVCNDIEDNSDINVNLRYSGLAVIWMKSEKWPMRERSSETIDSLPGSG